MMKKKGPLGPTPAEQRSRSQISQLERQLKHESERAERAEKQRDALQAAGGTGGGEAGELHRQLAELRETKERLSRLYFREVEEGRLRSEKLRRVLQQIHAVNFNVGLEELLSRIAVSIRDGAGFGRVLLRVREPGTDRLRAVGFAGLPEAMVPALQRGFVRVETFNSWLREECKVSRSYFIAHDHPLNATLPKELMTELGPRETGEWHSADVLLVPLHGHDGELCGYLSVHDPADRLVPGREAVELLEIAGSHAMAAIGSGHRRRRLERRNRNLERIRQRDRELRSQLLGVLVIVSAEMRSALAGLRAAMERMRGAAQGGGASLAHELDEAERHAERLNLMIDWAMELRVPGSGRTRLGRGVEALARAVDSTTRNEPIGAER